MTSKFQAAILVALLLASQTGGRAESKPLELKWGELAPMIVGHSVELTLSEGGKVKGEAVVVREDALVMEVKGSSGEKIFAKGSGSIPRGSISLIKLERARGSWGRSLGTVIGVLAGVVVGAVVAYTSTDSTATGTTVFLGVATATAIGGYYAGRGIDRRITLIKVVP